MPPRIFAWVLRRSLPDSPKGRSVLGDLHEEYERRRPGLARNVWYALVATQLALVLVLDRSLVSPAGDVSARLRGRRPSARFLDFRQSLRSLARRPAYTLTATLTLALGIGLTTSIYTVVDAVIVRPLPFQRPGELVTVWNTYPTWRGHEVLDRWWDRIALSWPEYVDWRDGQDLFRETAIYGPWPMTLTERGRPLRALVGRASSTLFPLLGVQPLLGRTFLPGEDGPGAPRLAVLGNGLWLERFGGDRAAIGQTVTLDGDAYEIVGVLPVGFELRTMDDSAEGATPDLWIPVGSDGADLDRGNHNYEAIGRLDSQIGLEHAEAVIAPLLRGERDPEHQGARVLPRQEEETRHARAPVLLLFAAAIALLLISCSSVATLMIGETARRRQELATRAALGAGRWRIAGQLLSESLVLGVLGAIGGALLAVWGTRLLVAGAPPELQLPSGIGPNWRVALFGGALGCVTGLVFGAVPALANATAGLERAIRGGHGVRASGQGAQRAISVAQFALCTLLLVLAGLSTRTLFSVAAVDPGFHSEGLTAVALLLPGSRYESRERAQLAEAVAAALAEIPGVDTVTATSTVPFSGQQSSSSFRIVGRPEPQGKSPEANRRNVLPGFWETLGIPLLEGRTFSDSDRDGAPGVVVVSETMARQFWHDESPIGARILRDRQEWEVVGIVGDVRHNSLAQEPESTYYFPYKQQPTGRLALLVGSRRDPAELAPLIREAIWSVDRELPADDITTLESLVASSLADQRYRMSLLATFGLIALVLCAVGLGGVTLRGVAMRHRELGLRSALGADRASLIGLVVRQQTLTLALGLALGCALAALTGGLFTRFLYGVAPHDPLSFLGAILLLALSGLAACLLPARQAASVDPMQALRAE